MSQDPDAWGFLRMLTWQHVSLVLAVFLSARFLSFVVRWYLSFMDAGRESNDVSGGLKWEWRRSS
jgi:hypothetical protein